MQRTLENKNARRKRLMALPYPEKVRIVEKMRLAAGQMRVAALTSDFWKQFEGVPRIDCVKMKHDIQAKIYEETKDMTWEERREYFRKGSEEYRRDAAVRKTAAAELVLREEPPEYGVK